MLTPQKHYPKKHLGQHFLINAGIKQKILKACDLQADDIVLEIGPGTGALSYDIAQRVRTFYAVEKDRSLYDTLKKKLSPGGTRLFCADFLAFDLKQISGLTKIIGNLPYNMASPILGKLLDPNGPQLPVFAMVQYEFAKRMIARPHTKDYGALSCFIQYWSHPRILFHIKPAAFRPKPKVMSSFIHIQPRQHDPHCHDTAKLFKIIHQVFQQRRKTIANALSPIIDKNASAGLLLRLDISPKLRPEDLSLIDYIHISNNMNNL